MRRSTRAAWSSRCASATGLVQQLFISELHGVADGIGGLPLALADAIVEPLDGDRARELEAGARRLDRERDAQLLRDVADRELADRLHAVRALDERARRIGRVRVFLRIEQVRRGERRVAVLVFRVERADLHLHVEPARAEIVGVVVERRGELPEAAVARSAR